ncbi:hypothetical protein, unlikely [Trypanosoma congolense IL3000]|uniref:Uncharacterized protein n=1 Tax=Trypanosoma congolense (strain IL3000) TaxID=1068625 RepID=F9W557_TRYCI|nr:hypothetical protein, unlikely [Trypanosoma congolense IL3000]
MRRGMDVWGRRNFSADVSQCNLGTTASILRNLSGFAEQSHLEAREENVPFLFESLQLTKSSAVQHTRTLSLPTVRGTPAQASLVVLEQGAVNEPMKQARSTENWKLALMSNTPSFKCDRVALCLV